jgi:dihydroorotase
MLESEMAAAVAGGVTSLVCPPDTDPVLDEPGLVDMLKFRAEKLHQARVFPLGALTRGLAGEVLTEMAELTESGCVGFSQAEVPLQNTQVLQRALQYAATYGYTVWLRPQEYYLGKGVAASGPLATRLGLSGVPVIAETIALHTIFELVRSTGARVHLCRISSAAGVELVRQAKERRPAGHLRRQHQLAAPHRRRHRLLRQPHAPDAAAAPAARPRRAARGAGRRHHRRAGVRPHAGRRRRQDAAVRRSRAGRHRPGAAAGLALKWGQESGVGLPRALAVLTSEPARVLGSALGTLQASAGQLVDGGVADVCIFDPQAHWTVTPGALRSQGRTRRSPATSCRARALDHRRRPGRLRGAAAR